MPEKISTNILADRLKRLVSNGVLKKERDEKNKLLINYFLTEMGKDLDAVMNEIANWGCKHIADTAELNFDSLSKE